MKSDKVVKALQGSVQQKREEIDRQIREAILPFFAENTEEMLPTVCAALGEHSYVGVTNGTDLTVIWDSGEGIAITNFPGVGYIERPSAIRSYFEWLAAEMGLSHLIPNKIHIILVRSRAVN